MNCMTLPLIISPAEFAAHLEQNQDNQNIRIVDLSEEHSYLQGHIPGAIHLPYQSLVNGRAPTPGKLPELEQLRNMFQYLGHQEDTQFVVCDNEGGGWAGRFIWTLDVIGHKNYTYIDGGMIAWKAEGLPQTHGRSDNPFRADSCPDFTIDPSVIADLNFLLNGLKRNEFVIWDARTPEEFHGTKVVAAKAGHIPGAKNVEWTILMDPARHYKLRPDAREYLQQSGIDGTLPIVTHCHTHHRSGFTYLVGKALGYDIKAYDGSWSEWGNHPDTPVEK